MIAPRRQLWKVGDEFPSVVNAGAVHNATVNAAPLLPKKEFIQVGCQVVKIDFANRLSFS